MAAVLKLKRTGQGHDDSLQILGIREALGPAALIADPDTVISPSRSISIAIAVSTRAHEPALSPKAPAVPSHSFNLSDIKNEAIVTSIANKNRTHPFETALKDPISREASHR
jgi:hypothetical protein